MSSLREVYFSSQEMCPNCHEIAVGVTRPLAAATSLVSSATSAATPQAPAAPATPSTPPTPPVPPVPPVRRPSVTANGNDGGEGNTPQEPQKKKEPPLYLHHLIHLCSLGVWYYVLLLRQCQSQ